MADSTGSARQEAERLVATVLAMASETGKNEDLSRTRQRLTEGIGALGDTVAKMVGQLTGESPSKRPQPAPASDAPADQESRGNEPGTPASGAASSGGQGPGSDDRESGGQASGGPGSPAPGSADRAPGGQERGGPGRWSSPGSGSGGSGFGGWGWVGQGLSGWAGGSGRRGAAHGFAGWSTGSAECCVCPVCRAIAAVRDPSPKTAVRLATGAGDLATGVASVMRGLSALSGTRPAKLTKPARPTRPVFDPDVAWSAATRTTREAGRHEAPEEDPDPATSDPWTAATRTSASRSAQTAGRHEAPAEPLADEPESAVQPDQTQEKPAAKAERPVGRPPAPGTDPWAAATAAYATAKSPSVATQPKPRESAASEPASPGLVLAETEAVVAEPAGPPSDVAESAPRDSAAPEPVAAGPVSEPGETVAAVPEPAVSESESLAAEVVSGGTGSLAAAESPGGGALGESAGTAADLPGRDASPIGEPGSRIGNGLDGLDGDADVAGTSAVDHDDSGPVVAGAGSAPAASAVEDRAADAGDDARAGDAG